MNSFSALALLVTGLVISATFAQAEPTHTSRNAIGPRLQWEANGGYCGEVSLISAGLFFGQYLSQYDARRAAIGAVPQDQGEMLLGVNDRRAARRMGLAFEEWTGGRRAGTRDFLGWAKRHVLAGHPVIIGVYNNEFLLYDRTSPSAGDPEYDHIVPVIGVRSRHSLTDGTYFASDRLIFSDNGLFGDAQSRPFIYRPIFRQFPGDRAQANAPNGPMYTLPDYGRNYGLAILGVADRDGDTLPVRIETNRNVERPVMKRRSNRRPAPMPLTLTITISGLSPGVDYNLYRYAGLGAIPTSRFNANASNATEVTRIRLSQGTSTTFTRNILSNEIVIYRCVAADAP